MKKATAYSKVHISKLFCNYYIILCGLTSLEAVTTSAEGTGQNSGELRHGIGGRCFGHMCGTRPTFYIVSSVSEKPKELRRMKKGVLQRLNLLNIPRPKIRKGLTLWWNQQQKKVNQKRTRRPPGALWNYAAELLDYQNYYNDGNYTMTKEMIEEESRKEPDGA